MSQEGDDALAAAQAEEENNRRQCFNCRFFRQLKLDGACLYHPPGVHIIYQSAASPLAPKTGEVTPVPANTRPTVKADDFCGFHKFHDELSDAEMVASELENIAMYLREGIGLKAH